MTAYCFCLKRMRWELYWNLVHCFKYNQRFHVPTWKEMLMKSGDLYLKYLYRKVELILRNITAERIVNIFYYDLILL